MLSLLFALTIIGCKIDDDKAMKMKMEGESQRLELAVQNMRKEAKQLQYVIHVSYFLFYLIGRKKYLYFGME